MSTLTSNNCNICWRFIRVTAVLISIVVTMAPAIANEEEDAEEGVVVVAEFNAALDHWPEGLTIDKSGNIYVTQGSAFFWVPSDGWIKKISFKGPEITELAFFEDERGPAGIVVNARGDIFFAKTNFLSGNSDYMNGVYVANTSKGLLARIPIRKDGSAGPAELVAGDTDCEDTDDLYGMDGIALDVHGNVYALLVLQDKQVRIDPDDGSFEVLLTAADGLSHKARQASLNSVGVYVRHRPETTLACWSIARYKDNSNPCLPGSSGGRSPYHPT